MFYFVLSSRYFFNFPFLLADLFMVLIVKVEISEGGVSRLDEIVKYCRMLPWEGDFVPMECKMNMKIKRLFPR